MPRPLYPWERPDTPGPVWADVENLAPHRDLIPDYPALSESLYQLSYPSPQGQIMQCIITYALILNTCHPDILYLHQQKCEDPRLFFKAIRVHEQKDWKTLK
jgi:hypothetical protein